MTKTLKNPDDREHATSRLYNFIRDHNIRTGTDVSFVPSYESCELQVGEYVIVERQYTTTVVQLGTLPSNDPLTPPDVVQVRECICADLDDAIETALRFMCEQSIKENRIEHQA